MSFGMPVPAPTSWAESLRIRGAVSSLLLDGMEIVQIVPTYCPRKEFPEIDPR